MVPELRVITGPSGAGKTTIARSLAGQWGDTRIMSGDWCLIPRNLRGGSGFMAKWDWGKAEDCVKQLLEDKQVILTNAFNQLTLRWDLTVVLNPAKIILVESVVGMYFDVSKYAKWSVYLDAPLAVREARQIARLSSTGLIDGANREHETQKIRAKVRDEEPAIARQRPWCIEYWSDEDVDRLKAG